MSDYGHAEYNLMRARAAEAGASAPADATCPHEPGSPEARSWIRAHREAHQPAVETTPETDPA